MPSATQAPRSRSRAALAGAVLVLAVAPVLFADTQVPLLTGSSMLVLAITWNLLAGYADIVTVGQHGFVGALALRVDGFSVLVGINPYLSLPLAGLVALIVSVPATALVFRLRTAYLRSARGSSPKVLMLGAGKLGIFGGGSGLVCRSSFRGSSAPAGRPHRDDLLAGFRLAMLALVPTYLLLRSRVGIGLTAMRDNE